MVSATICSVNSSTRQGAILSPCLTNEFSELDDSHLLSWVSSAQRVVSLSFYFNGDPSDAIENTSTCSGVEFISYVSRPKVNEEPLSDFRCLSPHSVINTSRLGHHDR